MPFLQGGPSGEKKTPTACTNSQVIQLVTATRPLVSGFTPQSQCYIYSQRYIQSSVTPSARKFKIKVVSLILL